MSLAYRLLSWGILTHCLPSTPESVAQRNPQRKEQRGPPKDKISGLARLHLIRLLKPTEWQGNLVGREGKSHELPEARCPL